MAGGVSSNALEQFSHLVLPLEGVFHHAGLSFHAIQEGDQHRILHARLFLHSRPNGIPEKVVRFSEQQVGYIPLDGLGLGIRDAISLFLSGESFEMRHGTFFFPINPGSHPTAHFNPLHEIGLPASRFALLTLTGAALPKPRFSADLDWNLKANNPPYDSLNELLGEFRLAGYQGDFSCIEIPVTHIVEVDLASPVSGCIAQPGVLLPPSADRSLCSLGLAVYHRGQTIDRRVLSANQMVWEEHERSSPTHHWTGRGRLEIPAGASIKCFAAYGGVGQHEGWIGDPGLFPNWKRTSYECADRGCEVLRDFLFEERRSRKDSRDFEVGVSSLLWMMGFGVLPLRTGRMQDNPDLLLSTPGGRIVLVECTTDVIDKDDKLAKLHARARSMAEQLEKTGSGHVELLPVLVTSLQSSAVMDIEKAAKFGIAVMVKEDLQSALDRSIFPQDPDSLFQEQVQILREKKRMLENDSSPS